MGGYNMEILKNDIDEQRTNNWGFAPHTAVLIDKTLDNGDKACILMSCSMSYFTPKGKARLKPEYSYLIYKDSGCGPEFNWRFKNKTEAFKAFKKLK